MLEDIFTDIAQWRELGDYIVLMIDLNKKITPDTMKAIFANVGLTGDISCRHSDTGLVTTYQRGSHPIYGIYTSITLQVSSTVYLTFGIILSYHCLLCLKK